MFYVKIDNLYLQDFYFDSTNIQSNFISKITLRVDKDFCYLVSEENKDELQSLLELYFPNANITFEESVSNISFE
jgi:hypothetical protein